jgi:Spy/CpxP family protein refolding chaperone
MLVSSKQRATRRGTMLSKQGATRKVIVSNNIEQAKNSNVKQTRSNNVKKARSNQRISNVKQVKSNNIE